MRKLLSYFAAVVLVGSGITVAQARDAVTLDFFYDNLSDSGTWQEVGDYGYCWRPSHVDQNWRPYSDGRWLYSDAGWTWDSDESYGWAVYHYGRWADVDQVGWVWVPGVEWGPGWVSWRHNARYTGWAPLPPEAVFRIGIGFNSWVDNYYDIGPGNYRFMENRNFGAHSYRGSYVDMNQNMSIMRQTANITNISYQNHLIRNGGPGFDAQSKLSAEPLQRYKLDRRQDFEGDPRNQTAEHLRSRMNGNSLSVFAMPLAGSTTAPKKLSEKVGAAQINHGWKNAGSPADIAAVRATMSGKVKTPSGLPAQPRFDKSVMQPAAADVSKPNVGKDHKTTSRDTPPVTAENGMNAKDHPTSLPKGVTQEEIKSPAGKPNDGNPQNGKNRVTEPARTHTPEMPPAHVERKPQTSNTEPRRNEVRSVEPAPQPRQIESTPRRAAPPAEPKRQESIREAPRPQAPPAGPSQPDKARGQQNGKDKQKPENGPG